MTTSLIDSLKSLVSPELSARIASSLGEPEQNVSRGLTGAGASILTGMLAKTSDAGAMQQLYGLITDSVNDGRVLDNPSALVEGGTSPISALAGRFLSTLFGNRGSAVNDALAKASGLRIGAISSLMQIAGPLVMGMLGKRVRDSGLNADSLGRLLNDERDSIQRATPPGVFSALGIEQRTERPVERPVVEERYERFEERVETPRVEATRTYTREPEHTRRSWFWPAAATIAALALLWGMWPRDREPDMAFRDTSRVSGGEVVAPIAPPATTAPSVAVIALPSGDTISAPEGSVESRLVVLLRDPSRPVDKTSWFALDRLQFAENSANLSPSSDAQIADVVKILKAYPKAKVEIGGFTDNSGNEAANKKLSKERADAARAAIVKGGIDPSRVKAHGYGSAMPIADNSTEAGRAQNRRIAILVTNK